MAGDDVSEAQFAALCHAQHPRLVGVLTLYTGDRDLAHDLGQEALARVWKDWRRLRHAEALEAYLYRTAINLAKNHFRWQAVRRTHDSRLLADHETVHRDTDSADAVAAIAAVFGTTLNSELTPIDGPTISDDDLAGRVPQPTDPLAEKLAVFDEPQPAEDRRPPSFLIGGSPLPGVQYPAPRLREPRNRIEGPVDGADLQRARLAATHDDLAIDLSRPLEVYLVPHTGEAVDPDGTPLEGDWIHLYLTGPGHQFWGSAPIPDPDEAAWAGSVTVGGQLTGLILVGDGLDTAHIGRERVPIEDNVIVLNGFGHDSSVSLSGPAGEFTLTTPPQ